MKKETIRDELYLEYPEEFVLMSREQLKEVYLDENPNRWGIRDLERHALFSVWWHVSNPLLAALASAEDICKADEKKMAKGLAGYGYVLKGFFDEKVASVSTKGFSYEYVLQGKKQIAETIVLKKKNVCYTIYFYSDEEHLDQNKETFREFLNSMELK